MTNKQAIEILKHDCYVFNVFDFDNSTRINKALDLAVKALEQETCEDCIIRNVDLDVMLNACANAVNTMLEDGTAFFIRNDQGEYDEYEWKTISEWIAEVYSILFGESEDKE